MLFNWNCNMTGSKIHTHIHVHVVTTITITIVTTTCINIVSWRINLTWNLKCKVGATTMKMKICMSLFTRTPNTLDIHIRCSEPPPQQHTITPNTHILTTDIFAFYRQPKRMLKVSLNTSFYSKTASVFFSVFSVKNFFFRSIFSSSIILSSLIHPLSFV